MRNTSSIDATAPANAASGSAHTKRSESPVTTVNTAPAAAPLDTPRMYGSASGFRSSA